MILKIISEKNLLPVGAAVALGAFDGIHIGHRKLIEKAVSYAHSKGGKVCVFTFDTLPSGAKYINSTETRDRILKGMGVDYLYVQHFDNNFKTLSAQDFMEKYLADAGFISVGFNFRFGYGRSGDTAVLGEFCKKNRINLNVEPPVMYKNEPVSSTRIRKCVENSEFDSACDMLGRYYGICGTVVHGNEIGRTIGFPTANMSVCADALLPADGVYITAADVGGKIYKSFTNYGPKPTFGDSKKVLETNIFDFDGDLYGRNITVYFLERIRDITAFSSAEELKNRLLCDKQKSLDFFSKKGLQTDKFVV